MRQDFIITRNTFTKELVKSFRKDFMQEISSELRTLARSQLVKLNKEASNLNAEEKEKNKKVQKLFVCKFFFENEAWLNSVMN